MRGPMLRQAMTSADKDRIQFADRQQMTKALVHRKLSYRIKILDPSRVTTDECLSESRRAACSDAFICFDGGRNALSVSFGLCHRTLGFFGRRLHLTEPALELVATLASHNDAPSRCCCDAVRIRNGDAHRTPRTSHRLSVMAFRTVSEWPQRKTHAEKPSTKPPEITRHER